MYIKAEHIYWDIAKDVEAKCNTSYNELDRPLPKEKNRKVIRLMKDKLGKKKLTLSHWDQNHVVIL